MSPKPKWAPLKPSRPMPGGFYSNPHLHGCERCRFTIWNCRCQTPERDPLCSLCSIGRERPFWPRAWSAAPCCVTDSTPVRKDKRNEFLLAGTGEWFQCSSCSRFFAFDPSKEVPPLDRDEWQERYGELPRTPQTTEEWVESIRRYG